MDDVHKTVAERVKPHRPRWWQFTILRLLVLTAFCAVLLGWYRDRVALREARLDAERQKAHAEQQRLLADMVRIEAEARLDTARAQAAIAHEEKKMAEHMAAEADLKRQAAEERTRRLLEQVTRTKKLGATPPD